jgi:hypothetical protein
LTDGNRPLDRTLLRFLFCAHFVKRLAVSSSCKVVPCWACSLSDVNRQISSIGRKTKGVLDNEFKT